MSTTAFVTGATGFVAQNLVKHLLTNNFKVVGSVRSEAKGEHLKSLFKSGFDYVVVPDIAKAGAFDQALISHPEIKVFYHTASPFTVNVQDVEKELLQPAIAGTRNALESATKNGANLEKFVLTSSFAAIIFSIIFGKTPDHTAIVNEDTWTQVTYEQALVNGPFGYVGSKTLAEKAAWEYVKEHKPKFGFTVINPSYIFGPQAFDSEVGDVLNASNEIINSILKSGPSDALPAEKNYFYDVRDVAKAHLIAYQNRTTDGKRLLLKSEVFSSQSIANIIHKHFPELNDKIPRGNPEDNDLSGAIDGILDDTKTRQYVKTDTITLEQSIVDTVRQLLNARK